MKWQVRITGDDTGLGDLSEGFDEDPEIFEEDGDYYIWSSEFESLDDPIEVRDAAREIVRIIRNFGVRDSLWVNDLDASHVCRIQDDGSKHVHAIVEAETVQARVRVGVAEVSGGKGDEPQFRADRTRQWTELALTDDKVSELAELLDKGEGWVNLYRIYEFIQDNIESEDNIVSQSWWTSSEKDHFKRTANSRGAIGDEARHARESFPPPEEPMSHGEAKRLVGRLVDQWLQHRSKIREERVDD